MNRVLKYNTEINRFTRFFFYFFALNRFLTEFLSQLLVYRCIACLCVFLLASVTCIAFFYYFLCSLFCSLSFYWFTDLVYIKKLKGCTEPYTIQTPSIELPWPMNMVFIFCYSFCCDVGPI
jgi:hypothetical protein